MTLIETLAQWCAAPPPFSPQARQLAREAITDTLACLAAGRDDFSTRAVQQMLGDEPHGLAQSALLNATAAHAIDYDDNFAPGMSHASAVLLPALLPVALAQKSCGAELIAAYLVGLQAQAFIGDVVGYGHYTAGWHGTSTIGCIGSAAGVAALMGLDAAAIARTLSIAVSLASGVKGQFGTPLKPFHAGMAARNAVEAALLARTGLHGRLDILECAQGFAELYAGTLTRPTRLQDPQHVIESVGLMPKKYPCCGSTHRILDAIADLQTQYDLRDDDIEQVHCQVGIANWRNLAYPLPTDEMQARFSMPYCVAVMLEKGELSVEDFTPSAVAAQANKHRLARISMTAWSPEQEAENTDLPHRVTVTLKDGSTLSHSRLQARGTLKEPFSAAERQAKFIDCCRGTDNAGGIYQQMVTLEKAKNIAFIRQLMA
ncbi:2-methylcitrate dehydratase PrpD [Enterobacter sp. BIGb0383]|uniref:MmgE/PrpD family protein n=1 Tax=unclassified Enterobacter TaxID=2608935 RepID=UPI000F4A4741|nr:MULTISPECIES: MmgE/PrpD family protein [unclassified Enterobacter]ROP62765.1 2-methylcitrate dehydratase PrpD [Enterobacter sp. BIGb0383]ROS12926.1 2-methylcitrate dehydratase PrpD [Enterobacter sp. BIGb0359]